MLEAGADRFRALFGVAAFVIAVGFDPFAQQLIQYKTEVVYTPNNLATVPVARRYSKGSMGDYMTTTSEYNHVMDS